jgi:hypothetical protein
MQHNYKKMIRVSRVGKFHVNFELAYVNLIEKWEARYRMEKNIVRAITSWLFVGWHPDPDNPRMTDESWPFHLSRLFPGFSTWECNRMTKGADLTGTHWGSVVWGSYKSSNGGLERSLLLTPKKNMNICSTHWLTITVWKLAKIYILCRNWYKL